VAAFGLAVHDGHVRAALIVTIPYRCVLTLLAMRAWGRGRVVLIGDAIHPMTPDLAQGR
jgi:2-polyprenyl-6-methoxyphenol hydroxylase-like FAD-dependent oxidoreductase